MRAIKSSHDWNDFDKFSDILDKYLPASGEGETMASQVATAVSKLVYKWFNDGDVYDNTHQLEGWANDLSTYANWLYKYVGAKFLDEIEDAESEGDYEDILYSLCENLAVPEKLVDWDNKPKVDSVYKCEGPFEFVDREDEDDDWDDDEDDYDEEEDIESSRKGIKSSILADEFSHLDKNVRKALGELEDYFGASCDGEGHISTKRITSEDEIEISNVCEKYGCDSAVGTYGVTIYPMEDNEDIDSSRKSIKSSKDDDKYGFYWYNDYIYDRNGNYWYFGDYIHGSGGVEPYSSYIQAVKATADGVRDNSWDDEISDPEDYAYALVDYAVETLGDPGKFIKEYDF